MTTLDLGCGPNKRGDVGMDAFPHPGVDVVRDMRSVPWDFPDGAFDQVLAIQTLEHLPYDGIEDQDSLFAVMREIHRVLVPGGVARIEVPHEKSHEAWGSPAHRRTFNERTFEWFGPDRRDPRWNAPRFSRINVRVDRSFRVGRYTEVEVERRAPRLYRALCGAGRGRPRNLVIELVK